MAFVVNLQEARIVGAKKLLVCIGVSPYNLVAVVELAVPSSVYATFPQPTTVAIWLDFSQESSEC